MAEDLGAFARKLDRFADDLVADAVKGALKELGRAATQDAAKALRADIGDESMSGWPRRSPFVLTAQATVQDDSSVLVAPFRRARGPWRVLESGRTAHRAGDKRVTGTRVRKRDGVRVDKTRRVKRNVGAFPAKNTWSEAVEVMGAETPKREARVVREVLAKHFKG